MKCPVCNNILIKINYGYYCKNNKCKVYSKNLKRGWFYLEQDDNIWSSNSRMRFMKRWIELKEKIIIRDKYTCELCKYNLKEDFYRERVLQVHHIIPSQKESGLYFDEENLITLCKDCHKKIHKKAL